VAESQEPEHEPTPAEARDYQRRLGARLRAIRQQQGLTLQQVEELSQGKWKSVVVGSYERGDRAVSVAKLAELADFYNVPVSELLPKEDLPSASGTGLSTSKVMLDLRRLARGDLDPELKPVSRFAHTIQLQRGDFNGSVLTIRGEDLRALSVIYGTDPEDLVIRLEDEGILAEI
jgi:transcriptional regulator with XRE-family HTH domain